MGSKAAMEQRLMVLVTSAVFLTNINIFREPLPYLSSEYLFSPLLAR